MNNFLEQETRKELEKLQRSTSNNKKLYVKVTVLLGLDSGHSAESLSSLLGISLSLVYHYRSVYQEKGLTHYLSFHYQGSSSHLTDEQLVALSTELDTRLYPTSQQICEWIYENFCVYYTPKGLVPLLHRLGFSYKKSKTVPAKADKVAQETFLFFPMINYVVYFSIHIGLAKKFEKSTAFGVGMTILPFIFLPILAFGDASLKGHKEFFYDDDILDRG